MFRFALLLVFVLFASQYCLKPVEGQALFATFSRAGHLDTARFTSLCYYTIKTECFYNGATGLADYRIYECDNNTSCATNCQEVSKSMAQPDFVGCHLNPFDYWPRITNSNQYAYLSFNDTTSNCSDYSTLLAANLQFAPDTCLPNAFGVYQTITPRCTPSLTSDNITLLEYHTSSFMNPTCSGDPYSTSTTGVGIGPVLGCKSIGLGTVSWRCEPTANYVPTSPPFFTPGSIYPSPIAPTTTQIPVGGTPNVPSSAATLLAAFSFLVTVMSIVLLA